MKPLVLCILDGCGLRAESDGNAFKNADKPTLRMLVEKYPHSLLQASGSYVGLLEGQMGTSEVGHTNLGSGRISLAPIQIINKAIEDNSIFSNKNILDVFNYVKKNKSNLHIFGLLSDGGVHSHIDHLMVLLDMCKQNGVNNVYLDICTDGRDTYEKSSLKYLKILDDKLKELGIGCIATIQGRYYAMDRDNNFDRIKLSYDAMCYGIGKVYDNYEALINENHDKNITDEFIIPGIINKKPITDKDAVITFNFRKDRLREMFTLLSNSNEYKTAAKKQGIKAKKYKHLKTLTMLPVIDVVKSPHAFNDVDMKNILSEYLHNNKISQLRIAETEKYPHVTFYFDGGKEIEYDDMKKILIPSPKVATYDLKPEMSVYEITDSFLKEVKNYDVTIMNFANGDMVGHTGVYEAALEAVEHMDKCLAKVYDKVMQLDGTLIVVADHGNCDVMWDDNKKPVTSHTTNPVPLIITKEGIELKDGKLADVAPTMLSLLGLPIPEEMTGEVLIK